MDSPELREALEPLGDAAYTTYAAAAGRMSPPRAVEDAVAFATAERPSSSVHAPGHALGRPVVSPEPAVPHPNGRQPTTATTEQRARRPPSTSTRPRRIGMDALIDCGPSTRRVRMAASG